MSENFEEWYREQYRPVLVACIALSGNVDAARDAADEAFSRAFERWDTVASMAASGGWVCRVALNCLRRATRRRRYESLLLRRGTPSWTDMVIPHPELWTAVGALPPRQRIAVVLRYVADLPEAEVAVAMGVARGTVAATLSAARKRPAADLVDDLKEAEHG